LFFKLNKVFLECGDSYIPRATWSTRITSKSSIFPSVITAPVVVIVVLVSGDNRRQATLTATSATTATTFKVNQINFLLIY